MAKNPTYDALMPDGSIKSKTSRLAPTFAVVGKRTGSEEWLIASWCGRHDLAVKALNSRDNRAFREQRIVAVRPR